MNSNRYLLCVVLSPICAISLQMRAASNYAERELLVKWNDGPDSKAAAVGNSQIGSKVKRNFSQLGWQQVRLPDGMSVHAGIEAYQALNTVLAAEPDEVIASEPPPREEPAKPKTPGDGIEIPDTVGTVRTERLTGELHGLTTGLIANDPMISKQWYLGKIGATNAWATTTGSSNVVVAIFDTGVDYRHEDLKANMWRNPGETGTDATGHDKATNGIDDDGNGYIDDVYGVDAVTGSGDPLDIGYWDSTQPALEKEWHGTYIAGLIGGVGNNLTGIAGVNWTVQIMAIRLYGGDLSENPTHRNWSSDFLAAWDYVIKMKRRGVNIRVVNHSYALWFSRALNEAWAAAGENGILSVFGAGNSKADQDLWSWFPNASNLPSIINVAASTETDSLADFANFGRSTVHLAAPGVNMMSTWFGSKYTPVGGWGSSFSAPLVVGAAALLLAARSDLTLSEVRTALLASVDQSPALRGKVITNGRLNVARALQYLTNTSAPPLIVHASPAGQLTQTNDPLQVTFSRPMDRTSVESALSISPSIGGRFEWSEDSTSFTFHFSAPLSLATNYVARVSGIAHDLTGATIDGNFDGISQGSPGDDYLFTFRFPIANDDFANAELLTGSTGSVRGNNRYASLEIGEPYHVNGEFRKTGSSLWYQWTPPSGGRFNFDLTSGTVFDSLLAVYSGDRLADLVARAGNDNYGTRQSSRLSFAAEPGTNYVVVVASKAGFDQTQAGPFTLSWYPTPSPSFTGSQFSPQSAAPGTKITITGTNFTGATAVLFNGARASFANALTNNLDLRITAIVPPDATSGPINILTPHGNVTSGASFQVLPPRLSIVLSFGNGLEITWPSTSQAFVLEVSADLKQDSWIPVAQVPVVANGSTSHTLPVLPGHSFYRLRTK